MTTTMRLDMDEDLTAEINRVLETARAYDPSATLASLLTHIIGVGIRELARQTTVAMRAALIGAKPGPDQPSEATPIAHLTAGQLAALLGVGDLEKARHEAAQTRALHENAHAVAREIFAATKHIHEEVQRASHPQRAVNASELEGILSNIRAAYAAAPPGVHAIVAVAFVARVVPQEPSPPVNTPPPSSEKPN